MEKCDQEFIDYLDAAELKFEIHVKPWVECNLPKLSNTNPEVMKRLGLSPLGSNMLSDDPVFLKKNRVPKQGT